MYYVVIPQPIQIKNLRTSEPLRIDGDDSPWEMIRYLTDLILTDPAMGKGYEADRVRSTVQHAFANAVPGDYVSVEDAHLKMIRGGIESPDSNIPPVVTMQLLPFQEAFMSASREKPDNRVREVLKKHDLVSA